MIPLLAIASSLLVVAASGVAAATANDDERMTICHVPPGNPGAARTMEVSRSSWDGHRGHGDHEGACTGREGRAANAPAPPPQPRPVPTTVALGLRADGDLDGDATFAATIGNRGSATAQAVRLEGRLEGPGSWRLLSTGACGIADGRIACQLGDLAPGAKVEVRLAYDGDPALCRTVSADLTIAAANDGSRGDDRAKDSVRVGACAPLDPDGDRDGGPATA